VLAITDAAGAYLAQLLEKGSVPDELAVRFVAEEEGITMKPDQQREGDSSFEHAGRVVLLLDSETSGLLADKTLDVESSTEGARLTLQAESD